MQLVAPSAMLAPGRAAALAALFLLLCGAALAQDPCGGGELRHTQRARAAAAPLPGVPLLHPPPHPTHRPWPLPSACDYLKLPEPVEPAKADTAFGVNNILKTIVSAMGSLSDKRLAAVGKGARRRRVCMHARPAWWQALPGLHPPRIAQSTALCAANGYRPCCEPAFCRQPAASPPPHSGRAARPHPPCCSGDFHHQCRGPQRANPRILSIPATEIYQAEHRLSGV